MEHREIPQIDIESVPYGYTHSMYAWYQSFNWLGYGALQVTCKAFLADEAFRNPKILENPYYAVWRMNKEPYTPEKVQEYICQWEAALGVQEETKILTTQYAHVILVKPSLPWLYGPPGIHFHTLLIRTAVDWPGDTDPLKHIYVTKAGVPSDAAYCKKGKPNIDACLKAKTLPFKRYNWDMYSQLEKFPQRWINNKYTTHPDYKGPKPQHGTHGDGIVDMTGDPTE